MAADDDIGGLPVQTGGCRNPIKVLKPTTNEETAPAGA